jgi:adenosine 3'-phospho 5'-phosphosulfate transporter B3
MAPPGGPPLPTSKLMRLAVLVLVFHVGNSILQEAVFHLPGFKSAILMGTLQAACVAALAYVDFTRQGLSRRAPMTVYLFLSIFAAASTILTHEASRRVNYPTQVIFKSSKLLFVMALRAVVMRGRLRTSKTEIVSAVSIVFGLVAFTWATSSTKKLAASAGAESDSDFLVGVLAIIVAVCCDAMLYIGEEKFCFHQYNSSSTEVILYCNLLAVGYGGAAFALSGTVSMSMQFMMETPQFTGLIIAFSLCNFAGTTFLLQIVSDFGSSTAVVVTSTRKMATVLCSYVIYPKPFTTLHTVGLFGVAFGIWLHDHARKQEGTRVKDQTKFEGDEKSPVTV